MKDPSGNIRDWVYGVLNGTVFDQNYLSVPVYSFPPKDAVMPYIVISEQMMTGEQGTKDAYITEHEVVIEIYSSHTGNDASYITVNNIADDCLRILRQRTLETSGSGGASVSTITGYNTIRLIVGSMITDRFITDTNIIIYKSINIRLLLEEN
jgi:hypothetical protein